MWVCLWFIELFVWQWLPKYHRFLPLNIEKVEAIAFGLSGEPFSCHYPYFLQAHEKKLSVLAELHPPLPAWVSHAALGGESNLNQ